MARKVKQKKGRKDKVIKERTRLGNEGKRGNRRGCTGKHEIGGMENEG